MVELCLENTQLEFEVSASDGVRQHSQKLKQTDAQSLDGPDGGQQRFIYLFIYFISWLIDRLLLTEVFGMMLSLSAETYWSKNHINPHYEKAHVSG